MREEDRVWRVTPSPFRVHVLPLSHPPRYVCVTVVVLGFRVRDTVCQSSWYQWVTSHPDFSGVWGTSGAGKGRGVKDHGPYLIQLLWVSSPSTSRTLRGFSDTEGFCLPSPIHTPNVSLHQTTGMEERFRPSTHGASRIVRLTSFRG